MRRKTLRCPCGARHNIPEGAIRIECPRCGRLFGQAKPAPNQAGEMERRKRQMERDGEKPK